MFLKIFPDILSRKAWIKINVYWWCINMQLFWVKHNCYLWNSTLLIHQYSVHCSHRWQLILTRCLGFSWKIHVLSSVAASFKIHLQNFPLKSAVSFFNRLVPIFRNIKLLRLPWTSVLLISSEIQESKTVLDFSGSGQTFFWNLVQACFRKSCTDATEKYVILHLRWVCFYICMCNAFLPVVIYLSLYQPSEPCATLHQITFIHY